MALPPSYQRGDMGMRSMLAVAALSAACNSFAIYSTMDGYGNRSGKYRKGSDCQINKREQARIKRHKRKLHRKQGRH